MSDPVVARPASTVLLVRSNNGLEVLMVQRPARGFFGGLMVFPGGAVEPCDIERGRSEGDHDFRIAGLRETAEEVGVAVTPSGHVVSPRLRGAELLGEVAAGEGWGTDRMTLVSRWITPRIAPKRFDTRFYLVPIEGDPKVTLDPDELVGHSWVTPAQALRNHAGGEWAMILPTLSHLRWLERRSTIDEAVYAARGTDGLTIIEPIEGESELLVRYRGEHED